jgi:hypothetical protein
MLHIPTFAMLLEKVLFPPCAALLIYCLYHRYLSLVSVLLLPRAVSLSAFTFLDNLRSAISIYTCIISFGLEEPLETRSKESSARLSDPLGTLVLRRALQITKAFHGPIRYPNILLGAATEDVLVDYVVVGEQSQLPSPVNQYI